MPVLHWIGKDAVVTHHKDVPYRLLEPVPELSCPPHAGEEQGEGTSADSGNLIVQGDNLLALKALLPRYAGQVKCIYIDPPYNTGNEGWVYNDNVSSPEIRRWLGEVVGKEGETLDRHDRWLCMMYPRLVLLKQFLREDGVIFASIGDDEIHHFRTLMDEIFGAGRRLATFVWRTDGNFDNQAKIKNCHEYVLSYAMNPNRFPHPKVVDPSIDGSSKLSRAHIQNTIVKNGPKNPVSKVTLPAGFPASVDSGWIAARSSSWPNYASDVIIEDGKLTHEVLASSGWSSKTILQDFIDAGFEPVFDSKGQKTKFVITGTGAIESIKIREQASHVISLVSGIGSTQTQSAALNEMGFQFPYPKPVDMVKYFLSMVEGENFIVMDSFAGSGTTAHSVLKKNSEDGGNRHFILVEADEEIARNVTSERVKRVSRGYTNTKGQEIAGLGGSFQFCKLGKPLFDARGHIDPDVRFSELARFVWFMETGMGLPAARASRRKADTRSPLLGIHEGRGVYLLYNGILKDRSIDGGNVLTTPLLDQLPPHDGPRVIYAARCAIGEARLRSLGITFRKLPYDLRVTP